MTRLAPAVTEVRPDPARWIGFEGPSDVAPIPVRPNRISWGENVIYGSPEGTIAVRNSWIPWRIVLIDIMQSQVARSYGDFDALYRIGEDVTCLAVKSPAAPATVAAMYAPKSVGVTEGSNAGSDAADDAGSAVAPGAAVAREVRELSGLSAGKLGDVFPVRREIFQRWISGKISPSPANLERLLALRHFLRALRDRVDEPRNWLLSPLSSDAPSPTAYDVLKAGNLRTLWDAIVDIPITAKRYTREIPGEGIVTIAEGSLRGRDYPTPENELDDYAELFDED